MTDVSADFGKHRVLRAGLTVMAGTISQQAVNLVLFAVITRELSRGGLDEYAYALVFGVFFETFSDFGVDAVTNRELNQRPAEEHGRIIGSAMAVKVGLFSLTFAIAVLCSFAKPQFQGAALVVAFGMFNGVLGTVGLALRARLRTFIPEMSTSINGVFGAIVLIVAALRGASVFQLVTIAVAIRFATTLAWYPVMRRRLDYRFSFDRATAVRLVRSGIPVAVSTFAVIVFSRSDQLILGLVGDKGELGGYAVAVRMVSAASFLAVGIGTIALPTFSHLEAYRRDKLRATAEHAVRLLASVILPLAVGATVAGGPLLALVFGERFRSEGAVLAVLVWGHFFLSAWVLATPILIARHKANYLSVLALIAAAANVGLNLWLLPRYGAIGAAWSSLAAYVTPFVAAAFMPEVRDTFTGPLRGGVRPAVAAGLLLAVLGVLNMALPFELVLLAFLTPAALFATRSITPRELKDMTSSFIHNR